MDGEAAVSIRVRVKLFAILRDRAGTGELTLELSDGATVSEAREQLLRELPALRTFVERVAFAVNQEYAPVNAPLKDGDEVALIPPVSGGSDRNVPGGCHAHARVGMLSDSNLWSPKPIWEAIDYVHNNPVKRGLCQSPEQWRWSSAADYMELGVGPLSIQREQLPPRP